MEVSNEEEGPAMPNSTEPAAERIAALEAQVGDLEEQLSTVRRQLSRAELDQWRARIDDLEVQAHLGSLEVRDELAPLVEGLRNTWLDARSRIESGSDTTTEVIDALRDGLEQAMADIRRSLITARTAVRH